MSYIIDELRQLNDSLDSWKPNTASITQLGVWINRREEILNALSARLREAERKGRALDLLNAETVWVSRWRTPKDGLCWSASTWMDGMVEERFSNDLLTAIEAAIAAKETEQ